jgi:ankyrin repeat protein
MEASQEGHVELVQYLIQNHADVNQTTPAGETGINLSFLDNNY